MMHLLISPYMGCYSTFNLIILYGILTEELITCEIRIDKVASHGDSDSWMTSSEVIMQLKLQSTMKALLLDALHCLGW